MADGDAAVLEAPPETVTAPVADIEVTEGHQRWDFPSSDAPQEIAAPAPSAAPEAEAAPVPEAKAEEPQTPPDPDEAEIERILKHPSAQARIDQLTNNRFGNRLQQERAAAEQATRAKLQEEQAKWEEATKTYTRLQSDDAYYAAMVEQNGEAEVLSFRANYQRAAQSRSAAATQPQFDASAYAQQFTKAFNEGAIGEFRDVVKQAIPFYGDLPEDVRTRVERAAYDPNGNWLADAMTALGKGVAAHIDSLQTKHAAALREAVEAGKNEAIASREEATPITIAGDVGDFKSWSEIELAYAEGRMPRADFQAAKRKFGITD